MNVKRDHRNDSGVELRESVTQGATVAEEKTLYLKGRIGLKGPIHWTEI